MKLRSPRSEIAVAAVALTLPTAVTWLYFVALAGTQPALQQGAYAIGKTIQFGLPIVWIGYVRRERLQLFWPTGRGLGLGAAFGLIVAGAMLTLYFEVLKPAGAFAGPSMAVRSKVEAMGATSPGAFLALATFYSIIHSLLEEYYWRWFVFARLLRELKLPAAVAISSAAFAAHHVLLLAHYFGWSSPLTWLFSAGIVVGGAAWAVLYSRCRSLYAPWLSHAVIDAAIFLIGYDLIV